MVNIQVFEFEIVKVGEKGFTTLHLQKIINLKNFHYVEIGINYIRFKQYVGIFKIGNLQIEILPKIDAFSNQKKCQYVLIQLLVFCKKMPLIPTNQVNLSFEKYSILEIYVHYFLRKIEHIIKKGLLKAYQFKTENRNTLKGKIQFSQQIQKNVYRKDKFMIKYPIYTNEHFLNQLIAKTLLLLKKTQINPLIQQKISFLLTYFSFDKEIAIVEKDFESIHYSRQEYFYKEIIPLCKFFLFQYSPQFVKGRHITFSFLFDMNYLWEEYIYMQLKIVLGEKWKIEAKKRIKFWGKSSHLIPDIVIENEKGERIIIDTKWKILNQLQPNHHDLQQMFVYNYMNNAKRAILIYPKVHFDKGKKDYFYHYDQEKGNIVNENNQCEIAFIDVTEGTLSVQYELKKLFH